jgi:hypothetical protein
LAISLSYITPSSEYHHGDASPATSLTDGSILLLLQVLGAELPAEAWQAVAEALPFLAADHRPEVGYSSAAAQGPHQLERTSAATAELCA